MRHADPSVRYLAGTPKGRLTKLEKDLATKDWQQVKDDVHVKTPQPRRKTLRPDPQPAASMQGERDAAQKTQSTRRHEGQYLLRSNLTGEDPAALWRNYIMAEDFV